MAGVRVTISVVPIVDKTMMSPKTHPKSTVGNMSMGISPNATNAPTPKIPETTLATSTPKIIHRLHVFLSSKRVWAINMARATMNVTMKSSVKVRIVAVADTTKKAIRRAVKPYVVLGFLKS